MIETIIKRDGSKQAFDIRKLQAWCEYAGSHLATLALKTKTSAESDVKAVSDKLWLEAYLHVASNLPREVSSRELQLALIKFWLNKNTWEANKMAGRLYASLYSKDLYGSDTKPTVKEVHTLLQDAKLMRVLDYSDEEYNIINTFIDHDLDYAAAQYSLQQIRFKYALRDRTKKKKMSTDARRKEFETPQFSYMRMAMALAEYEPRDQRLTHVRKFYEHLSRKRINPPTPYCTNLGTFNAAYASCCTYSTHDTAKSLHAGDTIAYLMTVMSAGIGSHIVTRTIDDPIRGGIIPHQGKLPYYRALVGNIGANLQNGRGGAATVFYSSYDPEIRTIQKLKNQMTPTARQIRGCDYSFGSNRMIARRALRNETVKTFSFADAPELYWAQYAKDQDKFDELYAKAEAEGRLREEIPARELVVGAMTESVDTGRHYMHFTDVMNWHTPFKEIIPNSNLCVAPETMVHCIVDGRAMHIQMQELVEHYNCGREIMVLSKNLETETIEYKKVAAAAKTGVNRKVLKITDSETGKFIRVTPNHLVYTKNRGYVEAGNLQSDDVLDIK